MNSDQQINFTYKLPLSILKLPSVKERTGLSRSAIYLKISKSDFPEPISLGSRSIGWVEHEITEWIEQRIQCSRQTGGLHD